MPGLEDIQFYHFQPYCEDDPQGVLNELNPVTHVDIYFDLDGGHVIRIPVDNLYNAILEFINERHKKKRVVISTHQAE